jgi:hypothetical protein
MVVLALQTLAAVAAVCGVDRVTPAARAVLELLY